MQFLSWCDRISSAMAHERNEQHRIFFIFNKMKTIELNRWVWCVLNCIAHKHTRINRFSCAIIIIHGRNSLRCANGCPSELLQFAVRYKCVARVDSPHLIQCIVVHTVYEVMLSKTKSLRFMSFHSYCVFGQPNGTNAQSDYYCYYMRMRIAIGSRFISQWQRDKHTHGSRRARARKQLWLRSVAALVTLSRVCVCARAFVWSFEMREHQSSSAFDGFLCSFFCERFWKMCFYCLVWFTFILFALRFDSTRFHSIIMYFYFLPLQRNIMWQHTQWNKNGNVHVLLLAAPAKARFLSQWKKEVKTKFHSIK